VFDAGTCFEISPRAPEVYKLAVLTCNVNGRRRLPTHDELMAFLSRGDSSVAEGGELTSSIERPGSPTPTHPLDVAVITDDAGATEWVNGGGTESPRAFRCVAPQSD
jgi:hypothetical protein